MTQKMSLLSLSGTRNFVSAASSLYGTEEEFLSEALGNGDLSTIPKEYRRYLQLFREKISMAGQKTLLNKAQQDFLDRFKKSRLGSRFFLYGGTVLAEFYLCHRSLGIWVSFSTRNFRLLQ